MLGLPSTSLLHIIAFISVSGERDQPHPLAQATENIKEILKRRLWRKVPAAPKARDTK